MVDRLGNYFASRSGNSGGGSGGGFVSFITAGDPDYETSLDILRGLPSSGVDIIELGMPFSDPMADGASIQAGSLRSLRGGHTMDRTFDMVRNFRESDSETPIVLMGYYNPIYSYGVERFLDVAQESGVDGMIVVDLPPEEDSELCIPALGRGLHFVRLLAPTSDSARLSLLCERASGFVYYVSVRGITGTQSADMDDIRRSVESIRCHTDLPIVVGFGLRDSESVMRVAEIADAAVVGSAIVDKIAENLGCERSHLVSEVLNYVSSLTQGLTR